MFDEKTPETFRATVVDVGRLGEQLKLPAESYQEEIAPHTRAFRVKMGRTPILLRTIEFRILAFLSATPYRAFTRRRIAKEVSSDRHPLSEEQVDEHIASLREQLGFFGNYIQSVPYIGYRFKE